MEGLKYISMTNDESKSNVDFQLLNKIILSIMINYLLLPLQKYLLSSES